MTPLSLLPVPTLDLLCFWALLGCLGGITAIILIWRQKRYMLCALGRSVLCERVFHPPCVQGGHDLPHEPAMPRCLRNTPLRWPGALYPLWLAALSLLCAALCGSARRWKKTHVTAASIKESVDSLPAGVCYYLDGGRCLLVNHR
jgi:hypothetical protein